MGRRQILSALAPALRRRAAERRRLRCVEGDACGQACACSAGGAKAFFEQGDDLLSDPPHETQGWYSVYDADLSTKVVLRAFAERLV